MKLSTFYARNPSKQTPWDQAWCQAAYLAYYLPLNWWRMSWATMRGQEVGFFEGFRSVIDFGSGLGSATFAFEEQNISFDRTLCVERSREAIKIHEDIVLHSSRSLDWQTFAPDPKKIDTGTLAVFSYSLTELEGLPAWAAACDGLMIVEPATQDDGRRLLKLRQTLIDTGWTISAPCTHQMPCPLLVHSERDWCHDRCKWEQPTWLQEIERHMPIKNGTLPFSYLLARKGDQPHCDSSVARMTGDLQEFKGFAKQLICRGPEREFVSFQKRDFKKEYPNFPRGTMVRLRDGLEKKRNELRPKQGDITWS